jgi:hypothetical protein
VEAHRRGVTLLVVLDKAAPTNWASMATVLTQAGIQTLIDDQHPMTPGTVLVIDSAIMLTGAFTLTTAVEDKHVGHVLVINNAPELVQQYAAQIRLHAAHAPPYSSTWII